MTVQAAIQAAASRAAKSDAATRELWADAVGATPEAAATAIRMIRLDAETARVRRGG